jgi:hypothetical protein
VPLEDVLEGGGVAPFRVAALLGLFEL